MKYTNKIIRKKYNAAVLMTCAGALLCFIGLLFIFNAITSGQKARENVKPMNDILAADGNHAAKPASFTIDREPVKAAETKDESYYLITDGIDYHLCGMTPESYEKVITNYRNGDNVIEGVTKVIIDDSAREQAAEFLSEYFGAAITAETIDDYVGDVHLRATEITAWQMIKEIYILYIAFAVPILIFAVFLLPMGILRLSSYSKINGTGKLTASALDAEANDPKSLWLEHFNVYLTPSYLIGLSDDITALSYNEISNLSVSVSDYEANTMVLTAISMENEEYTVSKAQYVRTFYNEIDEEKRIIFSRCREQNPSIDSGEEELIFKYPFYVEVLSDDSDERKVITGADVYKYVDSELKDAIIYDFAESGLARFYDDSSAVTDMTLEFDDGGFIIIRALVRRNNDDKIRESLDSFIKGQLSDGWGEGFEGEEYFADDDSRFIISFFRQQ